MSTTIRSLDDIPFAEPRSYKIMIVGACAEPIDVALGIPFSGAQGRTLRELLDVTKTEWNSIYKTFLYKKPAPLSPYTRKPDPLVLFEHDRKSIPTNELSQAREALREEVRLIRPNVILVCGELPFWALCGLRSAAKWRGSVMEATADFGGCKVIPTWGLDDVNRMWSSHLPFLFDLKRAIKESVEAGVRPRSRNIRIKPSFTDVCEYLDACEGDIRQGIPIANDIETRGGNIACIGFGRSATDSLTIPFIDSRKPGACYWPLEQELAIRRRMKRLLKNPRCEVIGQLFEYDAQYYIVRLGYCPNLRWDTGLMHWVMYPGVEKSLDFMSSIHADFYRYWKDDGKDWVPGMPEEELWYYNGEDICYTYEMYEKVGHLLKANNLMDFYLWRADKLWPVVQRMNAIGVKGDLAAQARLSVQLEDHRVKLEAEVDEIVGHKFNIRSPAQMKALFYADLGCKEIINRKTGKPTCNDKALDVIKSRTPLVRRLINRIQDARSVKVLDGLFGKMQPDYDNRFRTQFKIAGAETHRFSSSTNAFGTGGNLQTIPGEMDPKDVEPGRYLMPNMKVIYGPDPGYVMVEVDLERADLQVVIHEADDKELKARLVGHDDMHVLNAMDAFGLRRELITPKKRQQGKEGVHATNYGGKAPTVSRVMGLTVHETETFQRRWFGAHPGILDWQNRVEAELRANRTVTNRFGYRRVYFDRIDMVLGQALAWGPQSTVAEVINRGMVNLATNEKLVQILLQIHDSVVFQFPIGREDELMPRIRGHFHVGIPFDDHILYIGTEPKMSTISLGHTKKVKWETFEYAPYFKIA